ncbi:DUF397 domain-containing protein [Nocardia sp. CNY236]|uniref:DUF397 domain-containing protein n=1 Tax=Nocardia sp. CNY236 TaxID=1169152 RepID=UPI00056D6527|nr:DUF397 domain-containing protein [Nocardia sp. CNY236]
MVPQQNSSPDWRKSSFSGDGGGGNCVEVRFVGDRVQIRDSKFSRIRANEPARQPIVEVRYGSWSVFVHAVAGLTDDFDTGSLSVERTDDGSAIIRAVDGTTLSYTLAEWNAFVAGVRNGEFSLVAA